MVGRTSAERPVRRPARAARLDVTGPLPRKRRGPCHQQEEEALGEERDIRPGDDTVDGEEKAARPGGEGPEPDSGERGDGDAGRGSEQCLRDGSRGERVGEEPEDTGQKERVTRPVRRGRRPSEVSGGDLGGPADIFQRVELRSAKEGMVRELGPDGEPHGQGDRKNNDGSQERGSPGRHATRLAAGLSRGLPERDQTLAARDELAIVRD
jgi:hypothetical protein